ncbi:helix-turn-helix domain-containing protein [uncultured Cytophaga sp.]|uniref:helix-turn-helix domain-containing protein n=1 Tax=uncultured Cytophaga sp. TaxID=160238 RepID=UPI002612CB0E|nr:helix-turn-helix domain-containing protein [uncultured Cytophaga sp.]
MKIFIILLNLIAAINFIIMTSALMLRKNNTIANRSLAFIIAIPVFSIVSNLLLYLNVIQPYFFLLYLTYFFNFLFGPAILSYFQIMFGRPLEFKWKSVLHFIPSILSLLIMMYFFFLTKEEEIVMINNIKNGEDILYIFFNVAVLLHIIGYLVVGWRLQKKYYKEVSSYFTDIDATKYSWVKNFLKVIILLTIIIFNIYVLTGIFLPPAYLIYADIIATPIITSFIYFYVLYGAFDNRAVFTILEYEIYKNQLFEFNMFAECNQEERKYGKSLLDENDKDGIAQRLICLLMEEKIYLDKSLDLKLLSMKVGVTSHQLSQCINSVFNQSFYDLINTYRVEEAKKLLINPEFQNLKIEAIGMLAGFSSRTTFFTVFKKHVQLTPSSFLKDQISSNA